MCSKNPSWWKELGVDLKYKDDVYRMLSWMNEQERLSQALPSILFL
jgi:hypothetical protein